MELDKIVRVIEVTTTRNAEQAVNDYLDLGWRLLTVGTMTTDSRDYHGPVVKYVLGWSGSLPAAEPKVR